MLFALLSSLGTETVITDAPVLVGVNGAKATVTLLPGANEPMVAVVVYECAPEIVKVTTKLVNVFTPLFIIFVLIESATLFANDTFPCA
jgi:hypothetical protein